MSKSEVIHLTCRILHAAAVWTERSACRLYAEVEHFQLLDTCRKLYTYTLPSTRRTFYM